MTRDVKLKAANGKELPAVTVITITLEHLKSLILKEIDEQVSHPNRRIQWIVTVPAIWSEAAKQMMREAATQVCIYIAIVECKVYVNGHNMVNI